MNKTAKVKESYLNVCEDWTDHQKGNAEILLVDHIVRWKTLRSYPHNKKFQLKTNMLEKQIETLERITGIFILSMEKEIEESVHLLRRNNGQKYCK